MIANIQIRPEPYYRRAAFEAGLRRVGYTTVSQHDTKQVGPDDLLVLWNRKRGADEMRADAWERAGGIVLVVENGYLQKVDKSMYAISVGQHNGAGWFPVGDEDRFSMLGFELKPWQQQDDGHWLVCGQRGIGSTLMASPPGWGENKMRLLARAGLKVHFRPHPGNHSPRIPLLDDLKNARGCVIWSSNAGVRAMVEGVSVEWSAPHWICGVGSGREDALHRMAHGQWKHEEIATGEPFARMQAAGWGRKC